MPLNRCLVVAQPREAGDHGLLERRLESLAALYRRVAPTGVALRFYADARLLVGMIDLAGRDPASLPLSWGSDGPDSDTLASLSDTALRDLPAPLLALALHGDRATLVTAAGGVTSLYAARGDSADAWSSHAVAAAWMATGSAEVDPAALAELVSLEFTGGDRTVICGVRAVPQGTRISIGPEGAVERCFWPLAERWAPVDPEAARSGADDMLLSALDRGLSGASRAVLGLTGGVDSRTAAVAMRELGVPFSTFTCVADEASAPDADASRGVARAVGAEHETWPLELTNELAALSRARAEALWSDGAAPLRAGTVPTPGTLSHWVAGVGAEVGRGFYYRWTQPGRRTPTRARVERVMWADMELDLGGAEPEARRMLRERVSEWLDEAYATGHDGWGALDVLYGEQRVRRWGRAAAPRLQASYVPAFGSQELMRSLASLPLEDRLNDGFARRFIAARLPELEPAPAAPRRCVSPLTIRRAVLALRHVRRSVRLPPLGRTPSAPWFGSPPWRERRAMVEWLADDVLGSHLVEAALGERWQREVRRNFLRGEPHAAYLASWAAGPVALDELLRAAAR